MPRYTALNLTPETREFLKLLCFPDIPEEASYVIFDSKKGEAQYAEELRLRGMSIPRIRTMFYHQFDKLKPIK